MTGGRVRLPRQSCGAILLGTRGAAEAFGAAQQCSGRRGVGSASGAAAGRRGGRVAARRARGTATGGGLSGGLWRRARLLHLRSRHTGSHVVVQSRPAKCTQAAVEGDIMTHEYNIVCRQFCEYFG